jgi:hypothetical protein
MEHGSGGGAVGRRIIGGVEQLGDLISDALEPFASSLVRHVAALQ